MDSSFRHALYYLSVQEDELLEWATFWGFVVAAAIYFSSAYRQFKTEPFKFGLQMPWFVFGLGLFCFLVAMEEISWGQRLLGYRRRIISSNKTFSNSSICTTSSIRVFASL